MKKLIGFALVWVLAWAGVQAGLAQDTTPPPPDACTPARTAETGCATIRIPSVEIESTLTHFPLQGPAWRISPWEREAGHMERTDWFTDGNTVLGGHSLYPNDRHGVFRHLHEVQPGDEVFIQLGEAELRYIVREVYETDYRDVQPLNQRLANRLTLITCDVPTRDPETRAFSGRVVVVAERAW